MTDEDDLLPQEAYHCERCKPARRRRAPRNPALEAWLTAWAADHGMTAEWDHGKNRSTVRMRDRSAI